jgi:hypothetical protein
MEAFGSIQILLGEEVLMQYQLTVYIHDVIYGNACKEEGDVIVYVLLSRQGLQLLPRNKITRVESKLRVILQLKLDAILQNCLNKSLHTIELAQLVCY